MPQYTVHTLDRRFKLYSAGFRYRLEWPLCDYTDSEYQDFLKTVKAAEQVLGMQYFKSVHTQGRWKATEERLGNRWSRRRWRYRVYLREQSHLTLLELAR